MSLCFPRALLEYISSMLIDMKKGRMQILEIWKSCILHFFPVAAKIIFTFQFPAAAVIHNKVCFLHCETATAHNGLIYYTPFLDNLVLIRQDWCIINHWSPSPSETAHGFVLSIGERVHWLSLCCTCRSWGWLIGSRLTLTDPPPHSFGWFLPLAARSRDELVDWAERKHCRKLRVCKKVKMWHFRGGGLTFVSTYFRVGSLKNQNNSRFLVIGGSPVVIIRALNATISLKRHVTLQGL